MPTAPSGNLQYWPGPGTSQPWPLGWAACWLSTQSGSLPQTFTMSWILMGYYEKNKSGSPFWTQNSSMRRWTRCQWTNQSNQGMLCLNMRNTFSIMLRPKTLKMMRTFNKRSSKYQTHWYSISRTSILGYHPGTRGNYCSFNRGKDSGNWHHMSSMSSREAVVWLSIKIIFQTNMTKIQMKYST